MTTDELVQQFITVAEGETFVYDERLIRKVYSSDTFDVFSIALNDETWDVRYVKVDFNGMPVVAFEVKPVTVLRTEYRRV